MDYVLNIYKENEFLFAIGGRHMNYDNVIWWQLGKLIKVVKNGKELSTEELIKNIQAEAEYFVTVLDHPHDQGSVMDIAKETINVPHLQLYSFEDAIFYNCGRELVKENGVLMVKYEACDEVFDVDYAEFDLSLLQKEVLTFDEFNVIASFIDDLLHQDKVDVIINNEKYLVLTEI